MNTKFNVSLSLCPKINEFVYRIQDSSGEHQRGGDRTHAGRERSKHGGRCNGDGYAESKTCKTEARDYIDIVTN